MADGLDVLLGGDGFRPKTGLDVLASGDVPPAAAPAPAPSWLERQQLDPASLARQVGLTVRHGITGVTALPAVVGDFLNSGVNLGIEGYNAATGSSVRKLPLVSSLVQEAENKVGLPQPATRQERLVGAATSGMAGAIPSVAVGNGLLAATTPQAIGAAAATSPARVIAGSGNALASRTGMQAVGAGGAGAGAQVGNEVAEGFGFSPGWQLAANVVGGLLGGGLGVAGASGATAARRGLLDRGTPIPAATAAERGVASAQELSGALMAPSDATALQARTAALLRQSPNLSPEAAARAADFQSLGLKGRLGEITRDPKQYTFEQNIARQPGMGEPIQLDISTKNAGLYSLVKRMVGAPAEAYPAGRQFIDSLKGYDDQLRTQVSAAYKAARADSGGAAEVSLQGLAQDYAETVKNFADKVPAGVRSNFEQYGLTGGRQLKSMTIDDAESLLKVINQNRSNDPATNLALDNLTKSVKGAILNVDASGGPYAAARQLAAQRFGMHEKVPALEAAFSGRVAPDDFVKRFIVNGKTEDVSALAPILKTVAPELYREARAQLGHTLVRSGFGANPAGDNAFLPASYKDQLTALGTQKLGAFFTPEEVRDLVTVSRVGGYMNSAPAAHGVNFSNSGTLVASLLRNSPVAGKYISKGMDKAGVNRALNYSLADVPPAPGLQFSPEEIARVFALKASLPKP